MNSDKKEQTHEETTKVKGLGSICWFALFCALFVAGILYSLGYRIAAGIAAPIIFLVVTIPALRKSREFEKANKDEMFDLAYGKICAHIIDSETWALLIIAGALCLWGIPVYIALAFVGAAIYGDTFFRYYRWLKRGSER